MKKALHLAFSAYGSVLDIICCKTPRLQGQAWVVFDSAVSSTNALRALQGYHFYDRPLVRRLSCDRPKLQPCCTV